MAFDPASYVESGRNDGSEAAPYAVERNGATQPSGKSYGSATASNGGHVADGATYGGLATA